MEVKSFCKRLTTMNLIAEAFRSKIMEGIFGGKSTVPHHGPAPTKDGKGPNDASSVT